MILPPVPRSLNAIRSFRLAKSPPLLQRELAMRVGSTQADISAYELGRVVPDLPKALDIANALGRRVEEVFFELFEGSCERVGARMRDHEPQ
ncbi:MAG: helix-turn-helix transcriptional regulator [Pseudomonadota bacterium]|nr:helix-turn-helix transcriptional regulator [Pseudomonadota bacterium]